ncbi:MAG: hypothetical protein ACREBI_04580 [Nitrosotalea sp.]
MFSTNSFIQEAGGYPKGMKVNDLSWSSATSCNGKVSPASLAGRCAVGFGIPEGSQLKQEAERGQHKATNPRSR